MSLDKRLEIQIRTHGTHGEVNHDLAVAAGEQYAVAQHTVAQRQRNLVKQDDIDIVTTQDVLHITDNIKLPHEVALGIKVFGKQHSHIHIGKWSGLPTGV